MIIKRIHIVVNPASGAAEPMLTVFNKIFGDAGIDWDVSITRQMGDARRLAHEAAAGSVDAVAVYGGDGTVAEAAGGLIGSQTPLAILPGGTGNVTAAGLGIPRDLAEACALICGDAKQVQQVDVGQVDDHHFLLRVSLGLEASVVEGADREAKDRLGPFAYALSMLQALSNPQAARYRLALDGREIVSEGLACIIANSGYLGRVGVSLAPNIDVSDGLLDVMVLRKADLGSLIALAASAVAGSENAEALQHWQARDIAVTAEPPQTVQADGEMIGASPIHVRVLPQAVRIILPAASSGA